MDITVTHKLWLDFRFQHVRSAINFSISRLVSKIQVFVTQPEALHCTIKKLNFCQFHCKTGFHKQGIMNVLPDQVFVGSPEAPIKYQRERVDTAFCRTRRLGSSKQDPNS